MIFSDDFLASLRDNPVGGTISLCEQSTSLLGVNAEDWSKDDYDVLLEAYALISELSLAKLLPLAIPDVRVTGSLSSDCSTLMQVIVSVRKACETQAATMRLASLRAHFGATLGSVFCYEFSQGDLERIQTLINQLREQISESRNLEKEHQQRLLRRLEKLQSELHKKISDLDRFWGLIGDAGVVLGKLGNDAKPIVDRIKEIADIVWNTQSRAEELPSGTRPPMLEHKTDDLPPEA